MTAIDHVFKEIKKSYRKHYLKSIEAQLEFEVNQMLSIVEKVEGFLSTDEIEKSDEKRAATYKSELHTLVSEVWLKPKEVVFSDCYIELHKAIEPIFNQLEDRHIVNQKRERFYGESSDKTLVKLLKWSKRMLFSLNKLPTLFSNIFRKKKKPVEYWKHTIPFKNLAVSHLNAGVILQLRQVTDLFFQRLSAQYLALKRWEESKTASISVDEAVDEDIRAGIVAFQLNTNKEIKKVVNTILASALDQFIRDYDKVGTIEFPNQVLSDNAIEQYSIQSNKRWGENNLNWKNTIFALFEEWRSDLDILILSHKTLAELDTFKSAHLKKLTDQIDPEIQQIHAFIQEALDSLDKDHESIAKELKRINYQAGNKLDKELVPRLCEKLSSQNVSNLIARLEVGIRKNVEELSNEHVVVKNSEYNIPMESDDLKKISPYELISFETLGIFQGKIDAIKKTLFTSLEVIESYSKDLDHIITFSLSSAIELIAENPKAEEEAISIAKEGLKRADKRLQEASKDLKLSTTTTSEALEVEIKEFCERIMELTVNENVGELRLRISKAKAAKQAEELKEELKEKVALRKRQISTVFQRAYAGLQARIKAFENKYILPSPNQSIDREVSDFLMESQEAIHNLPLIYRRLYEIEPLDDLELFEGRAVEYNQLRIAFENWKKGRYAATTIVGEKWGGQTSFINYAMAESKYPYKITRHSPKENISTEEGLIQMMRVIFENDDFKDLDEVVDHLNNAPKQVVVLEDLQNMYLRKVGGFSALQLFFQLITRTSQNVFWVTSTTIYTWKYLSKAINMQEFFSYVIEMADLSQEQIVNIIWKRNRISGFNIIFESDGRDRDKKFKKLSEPEQQEILKKEFFSSLNSFAKSNVSLALIFWLLSTKKVDSSTITIGMLNQPNLNFLSVMSMDKVYVLHALLLHDGLNEKQLSEVLNIGQASSRLNLLVLLEDGIVIRKNDLFLINPIVFRNIVSMLKAKNLIH